MDIENQTRSQTVTFGVAPEVLSLGVRVVSFVMSGLVNRETDAGFEAIKRESIQNILHELSKTPIADDPILHGFKELHTLIGSSNRSFQAASESLLESVQKNHTLPRINLLVDIYNLISVETRLALGAHDLTQVAGNVTLRSTTGSEGFQPLGSPEPKKVRPGGYAYCDDDNDIICLLEVKQVEKTKATLATQECLYIVQGNANTPEATLLAAAERLIGLTSQFCDGQARFLYPPNLYQFKTNPEYEKYSPLIPKSH